MASNTEDEITAALGNPFAGTSRTPVSLRDSSILLRACMNEGNLFRKATLLKKIQEDCKVLLVVTEEEYRTVLTNKGDSDVLMAIPKGLTSIAVRGSEMVLWQRVPDDLLESESDKAKRIGLKNHYVYGSHALEDSQTVLRAWMNAKNESDKKVLEDILGQTEYVLVVTPQEFQSVLLIKSSQPRIAGFKMLQMIIPSDLASIVPSAEEEGRSADWYPHLSVSDDMPLKYRDPKLEADLSIVDAMTKPLCTLGGTPRPSHQVTPQRGMVKFPCRSGKGPDSAAALGRSQVLLRGWMRALDEKERLRYVDKFNTATEPIGVLVSSEEEFRAVVRLKKLCPGLEAMMMIEEGADLTSIVERGSEGLFWAKVEDEMVPAGYAAPIQA